MKKLIIDGNRRMIRKILSFLLFSFTFSSITAVAAHSAQIKQPKTVRDYFMLLPEKYFYIEHESPERIKEHYLEANTVVIDEANGYMSGRGHGAQADLEMALFKKQDGTYIIAVSDVGEGDEENYAKCYFLDYTDGKWTDISLKIVPEYNTKINLYKLPRYGTTIKVTPKANNREKKQYDLIWQRDSFVIGNVKIEGK